MSFLQPNSFSQATLSVRELGVSFWSGRAWMPVISDISFDVAPGETVAIVGESGSGKSVTGLSIMRLLDPRLSRSVGAIMFEGVNICAMPEAEVRKVRGNRISMIFQEPMTSLNPVMTIGEQIGQVLKRHRGLSGADAWKNTIALLERVRIPAAASRARQYPHNFSGGMRQRAMIAMALACNPGLLIADEPTTALDVTVQAEILDLIKELQKESSMSVLFITHDMGVVAEIAERTIVMRSGTLIETNETSRLFKKQVHPYTRALIAAVPKLGEVANFDCPVMFPEMNHNHEQIAPAREVRSVPMTSGIPVLEVCNLSTHFNVRSGFFNRITSRIHAVDDISLTVHANETLSVVGESGCGKTTAGRSILRLVEPASGTIRLNGENISDLSPSGLRNRRRAMQIIFQDPYASLNPKIRIGRSLVEPVMIHHAKNKEEAHAVAEKLLEKVGLHPAMMNRFPHEFSGGERQRICIARALMLEPQLIIADECVSALDVTIKAQITNLLLQLQEEYGLALLFISHDMAIVERVSHKVAVMYMGSIVEIGPRKDIFNNPQHAYTKKLIAAIPMIDTVKKRSTGWGIATEMQSPLRPLNYKPPKREYIEVETDHFVRI